MLPEDALFSALGLFSGGYLLDWLNASAIVPSGANTLSISGLQLSASGLTRYFFTVSTTTETGVASTVAKGLSAT